jgi:hypothetical protein
MKVVAPGSKVFVQNMQPEAANQPDTSRVVAIHAANGATVTALDNSSQQTLSQGQCLDIVHDDPIQIGQPQTYVPSAMPETAAAIAAAEVAMENPEDPEE